LNLLIVFSVFVFHYGMKLSFTDAIYFIVATVTTTGYGDISPRAAPTALKLYACLVMLLGSATMATLFSIITDFIVTSRFLQLVGRQRIPHDGHFVVVGLGTVGFRIVEKLRLVGARAVAIDKNPQGDLVEAVRGQTPVIIGDGRMRETLAKAGAARARAVIAVTGDDAANLGVALETRSMNESVRTVVRLFDSDFAAKVKTALHIDAAMGAFSIGAPTFAAAVLYPDVRSAFILDDRLFIVLHRDAGEEWHGQTPAKLNVECGIRVLMRRTPVELNYTTVRRDQPLVRDEKVIAIVWRQLIE
jgi:Trk K+ transport system NAD-binding subunit